MYQAEDNLSFSCVSFVCHIPVIRGLFLYIRSICLQRNSVTAVTTTHTRHLNHSDISYVMYEEK